MIKLCNDSVTIPLKIIFEESLKKGIFPDMWKKGNIIPAHKIIIVLLVYFLFLGKYLKE